MTLATPESAAAVCGGGCGVLPGNEHMHRRRAAGNGGGDGVEGGRLMAGVVVFGDDKNGHGADLWWDGVWG